MESVHEAATVASLGGPAPAPDAPYDLADVGYVEEEFLLRGVAKSYGLEGARTSDGRWRATPDKSAPFVTRLIVRRPLDPARFSGVVYVEWNNVSGGIDASPDWTLLHRRLIRHGHAWVGVTAQKAGVDGGGLVEGLHLKKAHPQRYGVLVHPGDAWSYDLFTQAGAALRDPDGPLLAGAAPKLVIAMGESQSAMRLVTYINAIDPLAKVFDGFLVHGRGAAGAPLDGAAHRRPAGGDLGSQVRSETPERIRDDARVPVLVLQSETDVVLLGGGLVEQPDGERIRLWEIAGAAHADTYLLVAGAHDDGRLPAARLAELLQPTTNLVIGATEKPINAGPQQHYVGHAAIEALDRWAAGGAAPAKAARLNLAADGRGCVLDGRGNATGGVRSPWVDAPTATLSGLGQGGGVFGFLFGTTAPFDAATLADLYPGGEPDYLSRFGAALDGAIAQGFLLGEDREEIMALAAAAFP